MSNEPTTNSLINIDISKLLLPLYNDLLKPGVQEVGKTLGHVLRIANTMLYPVRLLNEKSDFILANNLDKYRRKLSQVSENDLIEVRPEIGVPILQKLSYVEDSNLAELFIGLLTTASDQSKIQHSHPAFFQTIENLSPEEARILRKVKIFGATTTLVVHYVEAHGTADLEAMLEASGMKVQEEIEPSSNRSPVKVFVVVTDLIQDELEDELLTLPSNEELYLNNLERLGIVRREQDTEMGPAHERLVVKAHGLHTDLDVIKEIGTIDYTPGHYTFTAFGNSFIKACLIGL